MAYGIGRNIELFVEIEYGKICLNVKLVHRYNAK